MREAELSSLLRELRSDAQRLGEAAREKSALKSALGETLFDLVKLARLAGIDPEEALHEKCEDYIRVFRMAEESADQ